MISECLDSAVCRATASPWYFWPFYVMFQSHLWPFLLGPMDAPLLGPISARSCPTFLTKAIRTPVPTIGSFSMRLSRLDRFSSELQIHFSKDRVQNILFFLGSSHHAKLSDRMDAMPNLITNSSESDVHFGSAK
jgi:hypothetical protein